MSGWWTHYTHPYIKGITLLIGIIISDPNYTPYYFYLVFSFVKIVFQKEKPYTYQYSNKIRIVQTLFYYRYYFDGTIFFFLYTFWFSSQYIAYSVGIALGGLKRRVLGLLVSWLIIINNGRRTVGALFFVVVVVIWGCTLLGFIRCSLWFICLDFLKWDIILFTLCAC